MSKSAEESKASESGSKKLFFFAVDYAMREDGSLVLYEIQQAKESASSQFSKLSFRRFFKVFAQILEDFAVDPLNFEQYSLEAFHKILQRRQLSAAGLDGYQPAYETFKLEDLNARDGDEEENIYKELCIKKLQEFLARNPDSENFILKSSISSRGRRNIFVTREILEEALKEGNLYDLLKNLSKGYDGDIGDDFLIETVEKAKDNQTFRAFCIFDPVTHEFNFKVTGVYNHPGSNNSHDYDKSGYAFDNIARRDFLFKDGEILDVGDRKEEYEIPEIIAHSLKEIALGLFADLSKLPEDVLETKPVRHLLDKTTYKPPFYNQYEQAVSYILSQIGNDNLDQRPRVKSDMTEMDSFTRSLSKGKDFFSKEDNILIAQKAMEILRPYLPFLKSDEMLKNFNEAEAITGQEKNTHFYYLKKLLGFEIFGRIDKDATSEEEQKLYKDNFDKFMLLRLSKDVITSLIADKPPSPVISRAGGGGVVDGSSSKDRVK